MGTKEPSAAESRNIMDIIYKKKLINRNSEAGKDAILLYIHFDQLYLFLLYLYINVNISRN
ncbi:MAG: hypothetical protein BWX96_02520 [Bacteroidetes bacterium ADurb.Bin145]|jgi:hypothetical protein|nr:MAG: hypothetical protein BWX96_02520 [Bacteroidetes bacterium ADurb.Bin145]